MERRRGLLSLPTATRVCRKSWSQGRGSELGNGPTETVAPIPSLAYPESLESSLLSVVSRCHS
jgi:hypothetical protein